LGFGCFEEMLCGCVFVEGEGEGKAGVLGFVFCLECFCGGFWLLGLFLAVSKIFPDYTCFSCFVIAYFELFYLIGGE
jgi:hypothetical protein